MRGAWRVVLVGAVATSVAVAFADSSIVVLALPDLYAEFDTTIQGVAWVITSYNLVLAIAALGLVFLVHRVKAHVLLAGGALVFLGASIGCAIADDLPVLVVSRSVQGLGGALLLAGSLPVLAALTDSTARGVAIWTAAGTFGAALGPALGGILTQAFDWRAIFVAQAPIAGIALLAAVGSHVQAILQEGWDRPLRRTLPANVGLALTSGALVGALFLGVLLVIDVFGHTPIEGALIVSAIPAAALLARPLAARLPALVAIASGAGLLAAGLAALALLPSSGLGYVVLAFAFCGVGLGLAVPGLTHAVFAEEGGVGREATFTVGMRHVGLVLALAVIAPLLSSTLLEAADTATLNATAVIIDGEIPARTKVPLALDIRDVLEAAPESKVPDLSGPFEEAGAATDAAVRRVHEDLVAAIEQAVARGFRSSFAFCALLALLALVPVLAFRRRFAT